MVKRSFALFYAFIITSFFVISQYNIAFAAEAGAIETVAVTVGSLYSAIKSGEAAYVLTDFFEKAVVFASEVRTSRFVPSDTVSEFYNSYMVSLDEKIEAGDLLEADIGEVLYIGGKPVAFTCPTLGCYAFFCNKEIAERIDNYSAQKTIGNVRALVEEYWEDDFYRIRRPNFDILVADPDNWRCCFDISGTDGIAIESFWDVFGVSLSQPDDDFFHTGKYCEIDYKTYWWPLSVNTSTLTSYNDFFCINVLDSEKGVTYNTLYGHENSQVSPSIYHPMSSTQSYNSRINGFRNVNNLRSVTLSLTRWREVEFPILNNSPYFFPDIDLSVLFPQFGDVIEGANVGVLNPVDEWWKARDFEDAVDLLSDAAAEAVAEGATDVPMDIPDVITEDDLPITDWADAEDFVDTTGVIAVDDETDFPDVPVNPGPSPDPEGPEDPDIPELHVPLLLTLFPFCIPFDIKAAIEWFGEDNSDPIFSIPIVVNMSGRQIVNSSLVINLTEYGIDVLCGYLKTIQIIVYVIVLGYATAKVIY